MIYRLLVACFKGYAFILHQITAWERVCRAAPNAELCPGAFRVPSQGHAGLNHRWKE